MCEKNLMELVTGEETDHSAHLCSLIRVVLLQSRTQVEIKNIKNQSF